MIKKTLLSLCITIQIFFAYSCSSYSTIDKKLKSSISARDKFIKKNINNWRSQLNLHSNGGIFVLENPIGYKSKNVKYEGTSITEASKLLSSADSGNVCVWVWREGIPLKPIISRCAELYNNALLETATIQSMKELNAAIKDLEKYSSELKTSINKLKSIQISNSHKIEYLTQEQINTNKIAIRTTEYTTQISMILEKIKSIASEQREQLTDLIETRK